jgi:hypothetical protein
MTLGRYLYREDLPLTTDESCISSRFAALVSDMGPKSRRLSESTKFSQSNPRPARIQSVFSNPIGLVCMTRNISPPWSCNPTPSCCDLDYDALPVRPRQQLYIVVCTLLSLPTYPSTLLAKLCRRFEAERILISKSLMINVRSRTRKTSTLQAGTNVQRAEASGAIAVKFGAARAGLEPGRTTARSPSAFKCPAASAVAVDSQHPNSGSIAEPHHYSIIPCNSGSLSCPITGAHTELWCRSHPHSRIVSS